MHGKHFESKFGFNANDQQLINLADPTNPKDGVNLQYFERFKSVVTYDPTKGYEKNNIVLFDGKLYYAVDNIPSPAGNFNPTKWKLVLSPPSWTNIQPSITSYQVKSSEYILFDTSLNNTQILLPNTPADGETIYLIDIGGNVGYKSLNVKSNRRNIKSHSDSQKENVDNFNITVPYSFNILLYINGFWIHQQFIDRKQVDVTIHQSHSTHNSQSGEVIKNLNDDITKPFELILPTIANNGDTIVYKSITKNNTFVNVSFKEDNITGKINNSTKQLFTTSDDLYFTYNSTSKGWVSTTCSKVEDVVYINSSTYTMAFNESIVLSGTGKQTILLPTFPVKNSRVKLYTQYTRLSSEVIIDGNGKNITWDNSRLGLVSADIYSNNPVLTKNTPTLTINNSGDMRIGSIELLFDGTNWLVLETTIRNVATNPKKPEIKGNIALVDDTEILSNVMTNDNVAITPSQLQKRQSTELRMGIASVATQDEVNKGTGDTKIVTPQKLQATKASETQNGLAQIASQTEVNTGTNHTKIVTPKTLDNKLPNEDGKRGVVSLVDSKNATPASGRNSAGTGIYNFNDDKLVITPKTLHQLIANENNKGLSFKATLDEVLNGTADDPTKPTFITPANLSKRTATVSRTGIAKLTSNTTVLNKGNTTDIVVPSTLHSVLDANREVEGSKTFKRAIQFHEESLNSDGYSFHHFDLSEEDVLNGVKDWLKPVPINATSYKIEDGVITWETEDEPSYVGIYFYERMKSGDYLFEKLHVNGKQYQRSSTIKSRVLTNNGWDMLYSTLNKPTPKEINAIDENDIIVGEVHIQKYLDIIVNENERLRIYPDQEEKKVGFAWLTTKE